MLHHFQLHAGRGRGRHPDAALRFHPGAERGVNLVCFERAADADDMHWDSVGDIIATAKRKNQPWFIMANSNDPHRPFYDSAAELDTPKMKAFGEQGRLSRASREYRPEEVVVSGFLPDLPEVRGEFAQYYSSVRRCDDSVGRILAALEESGHPRQPDSPDPCAVGLRGNDHRADLLHLDFVSCCIRAGYKDANWRLALHG